MNKLDLEEFLNDVADTEQELYGISTFGGECYRRDCIFHDKNELICIADTFLLTDTEFDDNKKCK